MRLYRIMRGFYLFYYFYIYLKFIFILFSWTGAIAELVFEIGTVDELLQTVQFNLSHSSVTHDVKVNYYYFICFISFLLGVIRLECGIPFVN